MPLTHHRPRLLPCVAGTAFRALAVLATTALTTPAMAAEFTPSIGLGTLNGAKGFRLTGVKALDNSGRRVAGAGDVNGDGFGDVIVGAFGADPNGAYSGSSYVVFGKASGFASSINLGSLNGNNGFRIDGAALTDRSGWSVAAAGDVNGDGFGDLIVGAHLADFNGINTGSGYVVFGKASGFASAVNLDALNGSNGFRLDGTADSDASGFSVASAGDVNGDGFADVIVGAPYADPNGYDSGSIYVVFGKAASFASAIDLSTLNGTTGFRLDGRAADDYAGWSVAGAGDVNGDGFDDMILGAKYADPNGGRSGSSYVVFGKASSFTSAINLSTLNGTNGFRLNGAAAIDLSGYSVAGAGDINGDGFDEIIIGAPYADPNSFYSGTSYVFFGKASGFAANVNLGGINGTNGFRLNGVAGSDYSGVSVAGGGDVNGDGFADMIVGARETDFGGNVSGSSYVVFGKAAAFAANVNLSTLSGTNGFRLDGAAAGDYSGRSAASAGDVNGDDFSDVVVGAHRADPNGGDSGASYVFFGRAPDGSRTRVGSPVGQYISGGALADTLRGAAGGDTLEGRGAADVLDGGTNNDTASYAHAPAAVAARLAAPGGNTGHAAGDSYVSIENLSGSAFADQLTGNASVNILSGNAGSDILRGNGGNDVFRYARVSDSPVGAARDKIADFNAGTNMTSVDRIDLKAIDANINLNGNQTFTFIGTSPFPATPGRIRIFLSGASTIIAGDVNGDQVADFQIALLNFNSLASLTSIDFIR